MDETLPIIIEEPVSGEAIKKSRRRRYKEIYEAVARLCGDQWLPVTMQSTLDARRLYSACLHRNYEICLRKNVVYVRKKAPNA